MKKSVTSSWPITDSCGHSYPIPGIWVSIFNKLSQLWFALIYSIHYLELCFQKPLFLKKYKARGPQMLQDPKIRCLLSYLLDPAI